MRAQGTGKEQDGGTGPAGRRPAQVPGWASQILTLQRLAGNEALSRAVAASRHRHGPGCGHGQPAVQRSADTDRHRHGPGCGHTQTAVQRRADTDRHQHGAGCGHEETPVQRRVSPGEAISTPGRPLPSRIVERLEQEYPMKFGHVRFHDNAVAQRSAADHGAEVYTTGSHIVSSRSSLDDETMFHEGGHVWQQANTQVAGTDDGTGTKVSSPRDPFEVQAAENGRRMKLGQAPDLTLPGASAAAGGVQRAVAAPSAHVQRAPGNTATAPAPAPQTGLPPDLNAALGREIPDYWNTLQWTDSGRGYHTASLHPGHPVWTAIENYARLSQERAPVTAPKAEATRMAESQKRLNDPNITDEQRASHTRRLQEGKAGGPPPPSSALMDIVEIVVCANPTLWEKYTTNRQMYHQSLISHKKQGLEASGKDRSERIPWSTGGRPNLGGAASTSIQPGYPRPDQLPPSVAQDAGEAFFWHGTSPQVMDLIDENGPRPDLGRNKGTADKPQYGVLGQGTYVADNASKAQTYFACPQCEDPECTDATHPPRQMMLMRGLIGSPNFAHLGQNRRGEDHKTLKDGSTSVVSPGLKKNPARLGATGTNEFLIKDKSLLYPEIRVHYRRSAS
ncbi:DUF4157 domain-containing protein [Streptomyces zhihengii]|uniref:eCIS core domain-containing protein n=1 Tax=Streptomyces zhihengii TaxID=1818004 RepID=UPI0036B2ABA4